MSRTFKTVDDKATLDVTVRLGDCGPPNPLARFVVDTIAQLDLSAIYARYGARGGQPYAPEILFGLLFYGDATGVCSARKRERATCESVPFRCIAGNLHPAPDTLAAFRKTLLPALQDLFVQVLLLAQGAGGLKLGAISLDGTTIHADASKRHAVSSQRRRSLEASLRAAVAELCARSARTEQRDIPDGMVVRQESALRHARLARLAAARAVREARAKAREAVEQAADEAPLQAREAKARLPGRPPRGRPPTPPTPGPRDTDQENFTDPTSRSMKNSTDQGFDQHDNAQVAVDQASVLIVGESLSHHPTDQADADPPWTLSRRRWARQRRRRWRPAMLARPLSRFSSAATLPRTSRLDATRITQAGGSVLLLRPHRPPMTRIPRSRWPTHVSRQSGKRSTAHARIRLRQCSGASKRCGDAVSARCAARRQRPARGVWSVWRFI